MLIGGLFLGRFSHRFKKNRLTHIGFLLAGSTLLLLSRTQNILVVFASVFFMGVGNAFVVAPLQTILHEKVPRAIRGRVFGVQNMFINSAFTFPAVILGEVADLIGLRVIIVLLGLSVLSIGVLDIFISRFREA